MKNNKGYTLVELLVTLAVFAIIMAEVGSMMMNSSKLYRNGTYEVELQTEAQQIVQQMEELLIDVNGSVSTNYQPTLSSDFITISNNDATYDFTLDMDPTLGYGTLYFTKTLSGNATPDVDHIPMAEYVRSISLNMDQYTTADVVTLNVSMNNGRYGYQASQDIYLRNGVGTGGKYNYANGGSFDSELNVLRYKTYDLAALFNTDDEQFTYEWDPSIADNASDAALYYTLSHPDNPTAAKLETTGSYNRQDAEKGPYVLLGHGTNGTELRIKVSTDAVGCGNGGAAVIYQNTSSSYRTMAPAIVKGINIAADEITSVTVEAIYKTDDSTSVEFSIPFDPDNSSHTTKVEFQYSPAGAPSGGCVKTTVEAVRFDTNENDNTFEVYSGLFSSQFVSMDNPNSSRYPVAYYYYIDNSGAPMYYDVHVEYESGAQELDMKLYLLPTPSNAGVLPMEEDIANKFWAAVGIS